ncbi:MAG TPA: glycosyltransferase [Candidatus Dormibacteraeota bacterium]|nr:glycosyltransferase [Candidatus Dormibacteraeota bacterium]
MAPTTDPVPAAVAEAARRRADARAARDWATADSLRGEIEAAGWRVVDSGTDYRLEPASAPDVEVGGEIRYGRSDAVPSRLEEAPTGTASVIVVASSEPMESRGVLDALGATAPNGVDVILVADGLPDRALEGVRATDLSNRGGQTRFELVRTSAVLGQAAALNIGIRRARAEAVIVIDPCVMPVGDVVTPLVEALADPAVAIAGPFGLASSDLRRFVEVLAPEGAPIRAIAVQGYLMAFRRSDAAIRGPLDEGFRFYRNLDIWWSLVLRDAGDAATPRAALVVPGMPLTRGEPRAWTTTPPAERDRLSKRNFYRVLDRYRTRADLAASWPSETGRQSLVPSARSIGSTPSARS